MVRLFGFFICAFLLLVASLSCDSTEPPAIVPPPDIIKDTITVSIESFTHRSVTLRVLSTVHSLQSSIKVLRSFNNTETIIAEYPLEVIDTTITDDDNGIGLMLDTTYTYFAIRVDSLGEEKDTSNIVTQKTLAPTSHNYTWQEYTFGDAGYPNTLYDVWGTDENNVWVVGGMEINGIFYGGLHWDGIQWNPDSTVGGSVIFGFSSNDIWVAGGGIFYYDGAKWNGIEDTDEILHDNVPYTSLWGTSSSDMYFGNAWGKIIHWDGVKAEDMGIDAESGIWDIWGFSKNEIYAVSGDVLNSYGELFRYNGFEWVTIRTGSYSTFNADTYGPFISVWGSDPSEIYLAALKMERKIKENWLTDYDFDVLITIVRGSASNNVFAAGYFGVIGHFNGLDWQKYELPVSIFFYGAMVFKDIVYLVGDNNSQAVIYRGNKQ